MDVSKVTNQIFDIFHRSLENEILSFTVNLVAQEGLAFFPAQKMPLYLL